MSNMAKLRNWRPIPLHPLAGHLLIGNVYSDPRWHDGTFIRTSIIVTQERMGDALIARTLNTEYELCREDGAEWFSAADAQAETHVEENAS